MNIEPLWFIFGALVFIASYIASAYRQLLRVNTLLSLIAHRRPGYRRSGVVIPWPHVDYSDFEEDKA